MDCLAVGILVADHLCTPIERVPRAGELILCDELPLRIGGCAANASADLARVGVDVGVIGCVGEDIFGRYIGESLRAAGVRTDGLHMLPGVGTSATLIVNVEGEDRRFIHTLGASARFTVDLIPWPLVEQVRVLYVGGYLLMPSLDPHALADLFRRARNQGIVTMLDVVLPGPGDHWPALAPVLAETDVFLPNDDEARALTGLEHPRDQARRLRDAGVRTAVITCGGNGTVLISDELAVHAEAYPTTFVGGTGAGDAFDAGYIAGLTMGEDAIGCLKWGSALGASCVRSVGATDSVFTRDEARTFIAQHPLAIRPL